LPADDFGVRNGFRIAFGHAELPKPKELLAHGERWHPFATTAAWYLWRAADSAKGTRALKGVNA
jgi:DNA-3-methyladenine glycosylase II